MLQFSTIRSIACRGLLVAATFSPFLPSAKAALNIVVLLADDAGYADFGFMNQFSGSSTEFKTPHLDALAQQSVVFSNAYVSSSVCAASRAGLLTGKNQQRFGMDYNIANSDDARDGVPITEVLLPQAMKQLGYQTGVIGKWHVGREAVKQPQSRGVDEFYGIWEGGRPYFSDATHPAKVRRGTAAIPWESEASFNNIQADPVKGRHFTDAIGDEASRFISQHANQANPFFLYVPFTAPHSPYGSAKAQDISQFDSTSLTGLRKNAAALTLAMDRAIGNVLRRLEDPNGDGDTSDSIAGNTIVVFSNDNGGASPIEPDAQGQIVHSNGPLRDYKGTAWEGGIRVPMLIRAPNATPRVSNEMVSTLDIFPTSIAAANASIPANLDGRDLLSHLDGTDSGQVHESLFWRGGTAHWAVRKGNWKLVKGAVNAFPQLYSLNANGSGETTPRNLQNPAKVTELVKDFVNWEVELAKPTQTTLYTFNRFDEFRLRTDLAVATTWRQSSVWLNNAQPASAVTMNREDSYANAVLVFNPRNDASFTSHNNISRATGLSYAQIDAGYSNIAGFSEFIMNELRFDGHFNAASARSGTLTGYPLMFVKSLTGQGASLSLNATRAGGQQFEFNVNMDIVLHDNLEIRGNSTLAYVVGGQIRDFDAARSVTKLGSSSITFSGNNTYSGQTAVNQGVLRISGPNASISHTSKVSIGSQGTVALDSGLLRTPNLEIASGGAFAFTGGALEAGKVTGNLVTAGGVFRPGLSTGVTSLTGSYRQTSGTLAIDVGGLGAANFDRLSITGFAELAGQLTIQLTNGNFTPNIGSAFEILSASGGIVGEFTSITAPALPNGRQWAIQYQPNSILLKVIDELAGDFDGNGIVNVGDLAAWKTTFGTSRTGNDFLIWQRELGTRLISSSNVTNFAAVPEPSSIALFTISLSIATFRRRTRSLPV